MDFNINEQLLLFLLKLVPWRWQTCNLIWCNFFSMFEKIQYWPSLFTSSFVFMFTFFCWTQHNVPHPSSFSAQAAASGPQGAVVLPPAGHRASVVHGLGQTCLLEGLSHLSGVQHLRRQSLENIVLVHSSGYSVDESPHWLKTAKAQIHPTT